MIDLHVAIVAAGRNLAQVRILADSITRLRPRWPISVLVLPSEIPIAHVDPEPFEVLGLDDLGDSSLVRRVGATPYVTQPLIAGPALIECLFARGAAAVLNLGPDTVMLGEPTELESLIEQHDAVVVPRFRGELPDDGERPDLRDLSEAGELDDGLFAVRNTEAGRAVADWWAKQRAAQIRAAAAQQPVTAGLDQRRELESLPGVAALDRPGYGVSVWNLHERPLAPADGDGLTADGEQVVFLRLPGFRPENTGALADFATRAVAVGDPVLEPFCEAYAEDVIRRGWIVDGALDVEEEEEDGQLGARWLGNGLRYEPRIRRLQRVAETSGQAFGDLARSDSADAFADWLRQPARFGAAQGVNRYAHDVWMSRPDVAGAYPDLDDPDVASGFIGWLWVFGREEMYLQERLLPARPEWVEQTGSDAPSVLVTGYLRGVVGLGAAARGYTEALEASMVPVTTHILATDPVDTVGAGTRLREDEVDFPDRKHSDEGLADIHLFCVNADQTPTTLAEIPTDQRPPYTIGLWAWETDVIPRRWERAFPFVDEVWTYSSWIAENIAPYSPVPVRSFPIPLRVPEANDAQLPFALPDAFRFLFTFDFFSTTTRKNPVGLIQAFTRAFGENEGPVLVLKTINGKLRPADRARVQKATQGRGDVQIIDGVVSDQQLAALFEACDAYVSLHRAEGFGMTLAEAMSMGKPVIATGWSGNMDFTTSKNSYLVDYAPRRIGPGEPPYDPNGTWAEPSIEHAAQLMREIWEHQDAARERGRLGQQDVLRLLSPFTVGDMMRDRLERIASLTRSIAVSETAVPTTDWGELTTRLDSHLDRARRVYTRGGAVGLAQKALGRTVRSFRPYLAPYGGLDDTLVRTVSELTAEVEELRRLQAESQARVRHLEYRLSRRV